jgi:hypothetical protein
MSRNRAGKRAFFASMVDQPDSKLLDQGEHLPVNTEWHPLLHGLKVEAIEGTLVFRSTPIGMSKCRNRVAP